MCKAGLLSSSWLGEYGNRVLKLLGWPLLVLSSVWVVVLGSNRVAFGLFFSPLTQQWPAFLCLMQVHKLVVAAVGKKGSL